MKIPVILRKYRNNEKVLIKYKSVLQQKANAIFIEEFNEIFSWVNLMFIQANKNVELS